MTPRNYLPIILLVLWGSVLGGILLRIDLSGWLVPSAWDSPDFGTPQPWHLDNVVCWLIALGAGGVVFIRLFDDRVWGLLTLICWSLLPFGIEAFLTGETRQEALSLAVILIALGIHHTLVRDRKMTGGRRIAVVVNAVFTPVPALMFSPLLVVWPALLALSDWLREAKRCQDPMHRVAYGMGALVCGAFLAYWTTGGRGDPSALIAPATHGQIAFAAPARMLEMLTLFAWPFGHDALLKTVDPAHLGNLNLLHWLLLIVILRQVWRMRRRMPEVFFGAVWFFIALLPVSGLWPTALTPVSAVWLPLASIGPVILVVGVIQRAWEGWQMKKPRALWRRLAIAGVAVALGIWCLAGVVLAVRRPVIWRDAEARLTYAVAHQPSGFALAVEAARLKTRRGDYSEAGRAIIGIEEIARRTRGYNWYHELEIVRAETLFRSDQRDSALLVLTGLPPKIPAERVEEILAEIDASTR